MTCILLTGFLNLRKHHIQFAGDAANISLWGFFLCVCVCVFFFNFLRSFANLGLLLPSHYLCTSPSTPMLKSGRNNSAKNHGFNEQNIPQPFHAKCLIINQRSVSLSFTGLRGRQKPFTIIFRLSLELFPTYLLMTDFLV